MTYVLGIFMTLLLVSQTFGQTGNYEAAYRIQAGTELSQAIANRNFRSTIRKLATNIGPYVDMVGSVIGILFSSVGIRYDSPELTYLRTMYKRIENRFDQIDQHLKGIACEVQWNSIHIQFHSHQSKIWALKIKLDKLYDATKSTISWREHRRNFVNYYEGDYNESAQIIFNKIVTRDCFFRATFSKKVKQATDYNR